MSLQKNNFLESYMIKQKELGRRQTDYKKIILTKLKTRKESIFEDSLNTTLEGLVEEKNNLRARVWVAQGTTHKRQNQRYLASIRCHVDCQENLMQDIKNLKKTIANMEREISRVAKQIYEFNCKTIPDTQHQAYVNSVRKRMMMLENNLEMGVRRECSFTAKNADLREEMMSIVGDRTIFNESYGKLVNRLNSDKKYLIDLIEYAGSTFDNCISIYEKMQSTAKKDVKDRNIRKAEMQTFISQAEADVDDMAFLTIKAQSRELAELQPKELQRRELYKHQCREDINLYKSVLNKLLKLADSESVIRVIRNYQNQENLYYSYFNYANELSYHMTLLNNSVHRLHNEINALKYDNQETLHTQLATIEELEQILLKRKQQNEKLQADSDANDERLDKLLLGIESIFKLSRCSADSLEEFLGNQKHIDLVNVRSFMKLLEVRIFNICAVVYMKEREQHKTSTLVRHIEKFCEWKTALSDIVLTQQCPECAEGEAFNIEEGDGGGAIIQSQEAIRKTLYEKVIQPEMQYRLHSISQCRLPRSRVLAAKRNI